MKEEIQNENYSILIVHDERDAALELQEALRELGFEVPQPLTNVEAAVFEVPLIEPDLLLMEIQLEDGINGISAAKKIYENYHIPVIFLSANGDPETLNRAWQAHPFGYVLKPFNERQLEITIRMALHHHHTEEELRKSRERLEHTQRIAQLGSWEWYVEDKLVEISGEITKWFGFPAQRSTFRLEEVLERIHPDDLDAIEKRFAQISRGENNDSKVAFRIQRDDGEIYWLETSPASIQEMDSRGKPRVLVGSLYEITDHVAAHAEFKRREVFLENMNRITRAALENVPVSDLLDIITENLGTLFDTGACFLSFWREEKHKPGFVSSYSEDPRTIQSVRFQAGEPSLTEEVLQEKEPILIRDIRRTPYFRGTHGSSLIHRTYLVLPLISGKQKLGAISLAFPDSKRISQDLMEQAEEISHHVALALSNTRLMQETQERWQETEVLRLAGLELINSETINQALGILLDYAQELVVFDSASVLLLRGDDFYVADHIGLPEPDDVAGKRYPRDSYLLQRIIKKKKAVIKEDISRDAEFAGWGGTSRMKGWMGVPLIAEEEVIGILTLDHHQAAGFGEMDLRVVEVLANQAATAIQKVRLAQAERDQLYITRTLQETSSLLASGLDVEDVLFSILQLLRRIVRYDQAYIAFVEEGDSLRLAAGRGPTNREAIQDFYDQHGAFIIKQFSNRDLKPLIHPDVREIPDWIEFDDGIAIRSTINAPLQVRGELMGILFVDSTTPNMYSKEMADVVMAFTNQASLAINNAQLFERNQQLAIMDDLTGVYNRRYLVQFGEREVERALRYDDPLALIMFDIDHFKQVNDRHGHAVGDEILVQVSRRCRQAVREIDIVARYGGDEFVIILTKADLEVAGQVARRVKNVTQSSPIQTSSGPLWVKISLGVTEMGPEQDTLDELLVQVDNALYAAKESGGDCVRLS